MVAKTAPAKRKKSADMTDSPPKRVTRARAAKAPEDTEIKPKTTRITTASAKAAVQTKKVPATRGAKTIKRKTRADNEEENRIELSTSEAKPVEQQNAEPEKTTITRQKMVTKGENSKALPVEDPKPRGRQRKITVPEKPKPANPKTRGRQKKASTTESEQMNAELIAAETPSEEVPLKKATRTRVAVATARSAPTATSANATAARKKVQFEEDQDKENIPMMAPGPKKSAMRATGMKAKPIRKPVAPKIMTRRSKPVPEAEDRQPEMLPLSPKKVNQIAKTPPASSEDELLSDKTPIKVLSQSPTKGQTSLTRIIGSVSKLDFDKDATPPSPSNQISSSVLASLARRPPQSPFKDSMKNSPIKVNFGDTVARSAFATSQAPSPMKTSLLQESPRKGKLGDIATAPTLLASQTPFTSSLLRSPARRPMTSPLKPAVFNVPSESITRHGNLQFTPRKAPLFTENQACSPLRAAKSPGPLLKVHSSTEDEHDSKLVEGEAPLAAHPSAMEDDIAGPAPLTPDIVAKEADHTANNNPHPDDVANENISSSPVDPRPAAALPSIASLTLRRMSTGSQLSEDELASPDKKYAPTPLRKQDLWAHNLSTPSLMANDSPRAMTPLADQLCGWVASSPHNLRPSRQQRGIFSLGGPFEQQYMDQMEVDTMVETPAQSSFFDDEMAVIDAEGQILTAEEVTVVDEGAVTVQASMESQASQEYGDENAVPVQAEILGAEQETNEHTLTCTPAKVFTPIKQVRQQPREICTVSKVPLRPSAEETPLRLPRQRSKSLGGALAGLNQQSVESVTDANQISQATEMSEQPATPKPSATLVPHTPSSGLRLDAETPGRTGRKSAVSTVLKGAVVYVDVHTSEGADASGIFIELLTQMGARCVKQWNWTPRADSTDSLDGTHPPQNASQNCKPAATKIGITHVVYKDGGKRTLEKIRLSDGVVLCVGVGWVLE